MNSNMSLLLKMEMFKAKVTYKACKDCAHQGLQHFVYLSLNLAGVNTGISPTEF